MNFRKYAVVFLAVFVSGFFLASCLNDDNKIPPNCYDGILNNGEQLIDCGGPCEECNHCIDGIWQPELGETCTDCGGECGPCPQCANCIQDGSEVGIDCGGGCGPCSDLCNDGILNGTEEEIDCGGDYCDACPTCDDEIMNGDEIGIDCGGPDCLPCTTDGDCTNLQLDGDEFWIDCGGTTCPSCDTILTWKINGSTHVVLADDVVFSFDGTALSISGASLQGGGISIDLDEPASGWDDGVIISLDETDLPASQITFTDGVDVYSTGTAGSGGSVSIARFIQTPAPGLTRGSFSGTLFNASGDVSVNLSNGVFMVPLQ